MDMNTIQNDLNNILGDLMPEEKKSEPVEAVPETKPEAVAAPNQERIIRSLREIQRLVQEVLTALNSPTSFTSATPIERAVSIPVTTSDTLELNKILEGHFNGEKMIGDDSREYNVPPNYASKSKLVTGDRMKLTISPTGAFIYKQIGPIERKRVIGTLQYEDTHNRWTVATPEATYKVLPASISFYKGKVGDEVILFVPEHTPAEWGAVDQLIAK